jgi:hypothetical protein
VGPTGRADAAVRHAHDAGRQPGATQPPNVLGLVIVATAALIATLVTFGVFLPALGSLGGGGAGSGQNAALVGALPRRVEVCGETWDRGDDARALSRAEVFARDERDPITVDSGPFPSCPPEVVGSDGEVDGEVTVLYVEAAPDAYVPYPLVETP